MTKPDKTLVLKINEFTTLTLNPYRFVLVTQSSPSMQSTSNNMTQDTSLYIKLVSVIQDQYAKSDIEYTKQLNMETSEPSILITGLKPHVINIITMLIKKLRDTPKLTYMVIDCKEIAEQFNVFTSELVRHLVAGSYPTDSYLSTSTTGREEKLEDIDTIDILEQPDIPT